MKPWLISSCVFVLALASGIQAIFASEFEQIVARPNAYHHKRVQLIGKAHVHGDYFILYQPPKATTLSGFKKEIFLALQIEGPTYDSLDGKWVEVTGFIDSKHHGIAGFACELILERAQPVGAADALHIESESEERPQKIEFTSLLKEPKRYDGKSVTLSGFAHVFGDAFAVYEDKEAAAGRSFKKGIFVKQKGNGPSYNRYDNHWVTITGTIQMEDRGSADFPVGIAVHRVEPARPER